LHPPVLPLVVRTPYLSAWLSDARDKPWAQWPIFWNGDRLGLAVMAVVDGGDGVYPLLGKPQESLRDAPSADIVCPTYEGATYDASTTNLTYHLHVGSKSSDVVLSFLSPITPTSTLRQAVPASYITVHTQGDLAVTVYVDIDSRWATQDETAALRWEHRRIGDGLQSWVVRRAEQLLFSEYNSSPRPRTPTDRAEWGSLHFTADETVAHLTGTAPEVRARFASTGLLGDGDASDDWQSCHADKPVFAFSKRLDAGQSSVTFTLAFVQDPVIQYAAPDGMTHMPPLWRSWFDSTDELLSWHFQDRDTARALAARYNERLAVDAYKSGADDYVDIVALSARQVLGACVFAGPASDPIIWMKEISSDGNTQTVDVIYPAYPFFLYSNPRWLAYLLQPLMEYQSSGQYPNKYSMHDLGTHFPNATGHPDGRDEEMPVEECGNMLILGLALVNAIKSPANDSSQWTSSASVAIWEDEDARLPLVTAKVHDVDHTDVPMASGDAGVGLARQWIAKHYGMWKQWTEYLIESALEPENQLSTDDFAGKLPLHTNLALKGIIGINAMSELADLLGKSEDRAYYKGIADVYIRKWQSLALASDGESMHAKLAYNLSGSWTTVYNLYSDAQLCFHMGGSASVLTKSTFVPDQVYLAQSAWYLEQLNKYGVPLDNRHTYAKSDWEFFAMAVATRETRSKVLESVARWVNENNVNRPLTDLYRTAGDGGFPGPSFHARPVVGGHFAFLALEHACGGQAMAAVQAMLQQAIAREQLGATDAREEAQRRIGVFSG
ncbi:hypothetical protein KEM52_004751, partial [Ascosphaera acerosa]